MSQYYFYRYYEKNIRVKENNGDDNDIIEEWFKCLKRLDGR